MGMLTANGLPEPPLPQRFFWAMTEGLAATALLYCGRYLGDEDGGLKALRALSICVGLPYTFLICLMTVSMLRAFQYECKERKWGGGFEMSVIDVGIRFYDAAEGPKKMFNLKGGYFKPNVLGRIIVLAACPIAGLWPSTLKVGQRNNDAQR